MAAIPVPNKVNPKVAALRRAVKSRSKKDPNTGSSPYAAGQRVYGGGRPMPTIGPVDKMGYKERDAKQNAKKRAMAQRVKANQKGNFFSPNAMR